VQYTALEATVYEVTVYGKTKNSTPSKYKIVKNIQAPPGIYD